MRIGLLAPVATADVAHLLSSTCDGLSPGYPGAPFMATLIETFLRMGHEVVAFTSDRTLDPHADARVLEGPGFRLWLCPARPNGTLPRHGYPVARIFDFFRIERKHLIRAVELENTDILHAHWIYEFAMVAIATGRPCLGTIHDSPGDVLRWAPSPYTLGRYLMAQKVLASAISLTAVSPYVAKVASHHEVNGSIPVIANPLPDWLRTVGQAARAEPTRNRERIIAMILGHWTTFKNPLPGIQAFAAVRDEFDRRTELHLYGSDFSPGGKAEREIHRAGIAMHNIYLRGPLKHRILLEQLSRASVLLHTSLTESFGMAVAEAMAIGVPIIAGRTSGAIPWLLQNGAAGQLVDVSRPDAISAALIGTLRGSEKLDSQTRRARDAIWKLADPFTVGRRYIGTYQEML